MLWRFDWENHPTQQMICLKHKVEMLLIITEMLGLICTSHGENDLSYQNCTNRISNLHSFQTKD